MDSGLLVRQERNRVHMKQKNGDRWPSGGILSNSYGKHKNEGERR